MTDFFDEGVTFLTDSGLEATLVFHDGMDLPAFAAFPLLDTVTGRERLTQYYREHADVARSAGMGFVFEAPTWRANPDWAAEIGYDGDALVRVNQDAVRFCRSLASEYADIPTRVSGQLGPRGDGYVPGQTMRAEEAEAYHRTQIEALAGADVVTALTMNNVTEAIGVVRAARAAGQTVVISFTVETDGTLATGQTLSAAIAQTDEATDGYARPLYDQLRPPAALRGRNRRAGCNARLRPSRQRINKIARRTRRNGGA